MLAGLNGPASGQTPCWSGSGAGPVTTNCKVGIGASTGLTDALTVNGTGSFWNNLFFPLSNTGIFFDTGYNSGLYKTSSGSLVLFSGNNPLPTPQITIFSSGKVGIGGATPVSSLLAVAGTISASDVIVTANPSDYVFDPGYRLAPLSEVGSYIDANHHLPGIPSASEMKENGASLGEMQGKLLAKIEELTLHMIRAEKENRELHEEIQQLRSARAAGRGATR